jgi:NTP pyrophosphatase (non-canonical NTP hydrolase)
MKMSSFNIVELNVVRWGEEKGIIQNSTSAAQVTKTQEEVDELVEAIAANDKAGIIDAIGDVMVTLTMIAAIEDVSLLTCYESAYNEIKNRKGLLTEGIFVKES